MGVMTLEPTYHAEHGGMRRIGQCTLISRQIFLDTSHKRKNKDSMNSTIISELLRGERNALIFITNPDFRSKLRYSIVSIIKAQAWMRSST